MSNKLMIQISVLFALIVYIQSASNCTVNDTKYNNTIVLGYPNVLCLTFIYTNSQTNNTNRSVYALPINADQFSALNIQGLNTLINNSISKVKVVATFQNNDTDTIQMTLFDNSIKIQRQTFSLVINSNSGNYTGITVDNADCSACVGDSYTCIGQTQCFLKNNGTFGTNDPKFFISWIGTDAYGNHFLSHAKRLSRFTQYSVGSIYEYARSLVQ